MVRLVTIKIDINILEMIVKYLILIGLTVFLLFAWFYIRNFILAIKNQTFKNGEKKYRFAVLIPARNESNVIEHILKSLKKQTYDSNYFDVYVIVENEDDPTINIVKNYNYKYIVRGDLTNRRTKGYALSDAYQYLKNNNIEYDSYIIFDADNVLDKHFISKMNDVKNNGYKIGLGYRNFVNAETNWISMTSGVLFSYINQFTSQSKSKLFKKVCLTGTGYFIDQDIIDHEKDWIWNGLTEDTELNEYCLAHDIPCAYCKDAIYYDEEATSYNVLHKQHIRWIFGFFSSKKRFKKHDIDYHANSSKLKKFQMQFETRVAFYPFVILAVSVALSFIISFGAFLLTFLTNVKDTEVLKQTLTIAALTYIGLHVLLTVPVLMVFAVDNKRLKYSRTSKFISSYMYFYFFVDFVLAFIDGLIHPYKRKEWKVIEHKGNIEKKEAIENLYEKDA
ncbi:MAG: glycosyltransferase family 2 protein [Bacilli bacterium]|nr:glycosyltransferase family 2 protein [Bacilli bacterium]